METAALSSFLFMGLALGLVHALDPDHIAAVGGLSAGGKKNVSFYQSLRFGLHWSLGHGSALLLISLFVFIAGNAIPVHLSVIAERSVAYVLIMIGLLAFWRLFRSESHHNGPTLAAPLVGLLHGTAGSAPLLALIPISQISQPINGILYVLFFSAGVVIAMSSLSGFFAHSMRMMQRWSFPLSSLIQGLMAAFSLFLGIYLAFAH